MRKLLPSPAYPATPPSGGPSHWSSSGRNSPYAPPALVSLHFKPGGLTLGHLWAKAVKSRESSPGRLGCQKQGLKNPVDTLKSPRSLLGQGWVQTLRGRGGALGSLAERVSLLVYAIDKRNGTLKTRIYLPF